jgi:hypothetical protein
MIREKLLALRERRAVLVSQAEAQRAGVMAIAERVERATVWVSRARSVVSTLRAHPLWVAAGVALLVAIRPRQTVKLLVTGFSLWRGWQNLRASLERIAPARSPARRAY